MNYFSSVYRFDWHFIKYGLPLLINTGKEIAKFNSITFHCFTGAANDTTTTAP